MTYDIDLAAAKRARTAWGCVCGTDNPPSYNACHTCRIPSWTCTACGTVASTRSHSECGECDTEMPAELLGDRADGGEMTYKEWVAMQIGPRVVGGRYGHGDDATAYTVLDIDPGPRTSWPTWQITVRYTDGRERTHCTGWDPRRDRARPTRLTADIVVVSTDRRVLLIERGWDPYEGYWALPGGHVNPGETSLVAAARELEEETGLRVPEGSLRRVGVWDAPGRDPRSDDYSTVAYAVTVPAGTVVIAGDDARSAKWWPIDQLPPLAFDHADILTEALRQTA